MANEVSTIVPTAGEVKKPSGGGKEHQLTITFKACHEPMYQWFKKNAKIFERHLEQQVIYELKGIYEMARFQEDKNDEFPPEPMLRDIGE